MATCNFILHWAPLWLGNKSFPVVTWACQATPDWEWPLYQLCCFRFQQICDNSACRAVIKPGDTFCKRCSCCLCHQFDDNKDPSLWIACSDESWNGQNPCGLSCHLECALRHGIAGVVNIAGEIRLDGSYRCSSCGRVTGLIGSVLIYLFHILVW